VIRRPAGKVVWSGAEAAASAALSFLSVFLVARLIGPAELGIGAAAVSAHVLLWIGVNALFADALVQRPEVNPVQAASALWAGVGAGVLGALLMGGLGWPIAAALGDPRLVAMCLLLALPLPLVGAAGAVQGLLTRRRRYRALAGRTLVGQGLGTLAGIGFAMAGAGAWALVLQQCVTALAGALALILRCPERPLPVCRWADVRALLAVGLPLTASTLVQQARYRVFALVIGATAGPAVLGQVHMAFRLVDTVRELAITALWRLALPTMSERQHDPRALQESLDRMLALSGLVLFPAAGAMLVTLPDIVRLVLGPVWAPAGQAACLLTLLAAVSFLTFPGGVALIARGRARRALAVSLATTLLTLAGALALRPATPDDAALLWIGAQLLVMPWSCLLVAGAMGAPVLAQLRAGLPALALAGVATGAAALVPAGDAGAICLRLAVGAAVYVPGALLLLRGHVRSVLQAVGLAENLA